MKEVHIVIVDGRIIGVYAKSRAATDRWETLLEAAKVVDQLNEHEIFIKVMEIIE